VQLNEKNPVIVQANYNQLGFLNHLAGGSKQKTHYLLFVGYDRDGFIVHDPMWKDSRDSEHDGGYFHLPLEKTRRAIPLHSLILY
jgi:hypothetical protein